MALVQTTVGTTEKFTSGSFTYYGETNLLTGKATLRLESGKDFNLAESDKATINAYAEIFAGFQVWAALQLP